ncbi:MAG: amidohydrolase family protein [Sphingobium sp.]
MMAYRAALGALLALGLSAPALTSGLIDNVNGLTVGADGRIVRFDALLLDGEGRVEKRLQRDDKRPKQLDFRFDGKGRTLIPGFVDARTDVMRLAVSLLSLDLSAATSAQDAAARVSAYVAASPGRRWILGFGWDGSRWAAPPTAAMLDAQVADGPVWLVDARGEQGWANSAALRLANITATTTQPAGGKIVMAGGKPTGILTGRAIDLMEAAVPKPAPKDLDAAFLKAQALFLSRGITAVGGMSTDIAAWQTLRRAGDRNALRMRVVAYTATVDDLPLVAGPQQTPWLYDGRLRLAGVALNIDGSLAARRAWLAAPYADAAGESGTPLTFDTRLRNQMSRAAMDGFQIVLAAHGDRAVTEAASAIGEMTDTYRARIRWRIDGADIANATDLAGLPEGTSIVVEPGAIADGGALARARIGDADTRAYGWKAVAEGRGGLAFSGRAPFTPLVPLEAIRLAITRETPDGQPFAGWRPDQRLAFAQALRAATSGGAAALGADGRFGSLAPGEFADFLLLDRDIELAQPTEIAGTKIAETWIAGRKVVLEGKP